MGRKELTSREVLASFPNGNFRLNCIWMLHHGKGCTLLNKEWPLN